MNNSAALFFEADNKYHIVKNKKIYVILTNEPFDIIEKLFGKEYKYFITTAGCYVLTKSGILIQILDEITYNIYSEKEEIPEDYCCLMLQDINSRRSYDIVREKVEGFDKLKPSKDYYDHSTFEVCWESPKRFDLVTPINMDSIVLFREEYRKRVYFNKFTKVVEAAPSEMFWAFIGNDDTYTYVIGKLAARKTPGFIVKATPNENILRIPDDVWSYYENNV